MATNGPVIAMEAALLQTRAQALIRSLYTTPGTLADDLGCLAALTVFAAVAYVLLVLA